MRPRPQTRPDTPCRVPIRSRRVGIAPPGETPEGWAFYAGVSTPGPYKGHLDTGWTVDPPPGIRGQVVEILNNVASGLRVQGPVVVGETYLSVFVDSDVPLETGQPLFLLVFEQDFTPHAHCLD